MGKTSRLRLTISVLSCTIAIGRLVSGLLLAWLTLNWNVRRTRRVFEKQLMKEGMARSDAQAISTQYVVLRRNIEQAFKQSLADWRQAPKSQK